MLLLNMMRTSHPVIWIKRKFDDDDDHHHHQQQQQQ